MKTNLDLKLIISLVIFYVFGLNTIAQDLNVISPDKKINVTVQIDQKGCLSYSALFAGKIFLEKSTLGLIRKDADFSKGLKLIDSSISSVTDDYTILTGKNKEIHYSANVLTINYENKNDQPMNLVFKVSNDGLAFRYEFPEETKEVKYVDKELTTFNFPNEAKAWLHPHMPAGTGWEKTQPSYEENYEQGIPVVKPSPNKAGWSFPALFHSNKTWVLISEAGVEKNYAGSNLNNTSPGGEYSIRYPDPVEGRKGEAVYPQSKLPWETPWRVIIAGNSLATIVESNLITDLSSPTSYQNTSYIKPGKAAWTWAMLKDTATNYTTQRNQIDFAAEMGWEYCLIDAYWDTQIGMDKIKELADYAKTKNVGLLLWYNSAGEWNTTPLTPRNRLLTHESRVKEFNWLKNTGIKGIKVDFFIGDGQSMMAYYQDILEDAANYELLVNFHGSTIPRGWNRTYPNLVTMESVKGFEYITFLQVNADNAPTHCTMLPFTRNTIGPMDFTPVTFSEIPDINRLTSNAFELALSVLFQSGIQHYALIPDDMLKVPAYIKQFLQNIPSSWDEVKFIDGYPGKYVVLARKSSKGWYIAGINAEPETLNLKLDLLFTSFQGNCSIITDGENFRSFSQKQAIIGEDGKLDIEIRTNGGFVIFLPDQTKQTYIFPYFKDNGQDGLHLAYSLDGYTWKELNEGKSVMLPTVGSKLLRDPSITIGKDGRYHMVYTSGWYDKGFGYASSEDLVHWSPQQYIPVMEHEAEAKNVWAPEVFYDNISENYYIVWATTIPGRFPDNNSLSEDDNNHRLYYSTTKDFKSFSKAELFYDKGFNVIDGFLHKYKGKYYLYLKDETLTPPEKNIRIASSDKLEGPYSEPSLPITGNYWAEGPTVFENGDDVVVYFDKYKEGKYGALKSKDLINWTDISDKISLPDGIRHGSIFKVPSSLFDSFSPSF